ncbi:ROK family transcriptional regulator [Tepidanaerobacter acetatoxydans]|uniref:ROK family transcriptional regulator n=1 Tax=Tepidanaerobacter acetatoxydans TaxID=499229 RepID=UPI001BD5873F|nr:ROK family transcriptional regulator [Tepidanaerobacter acetatoxydans]
MYIAKNMRGKNTVQMQLENRSTLLKLLRQNEYVCRKDLAEMSGLTGAAVTNIIRDLINIGLVQEVKDSSINLGRNAIPLKLNSSKFLVLGAYFRRGGLSFGISDLSGRMIEKHEMDLQLNEPVEQVLEHLSNHIKDLISKYEHQGKIIGLGLAFPGPIDIEKGEIPLLTNLPGWKEVPIKKFFEEQFTLPVVLDDIANAIAVAEKWFGCGKAYQNFISLLVSKGVGAGVILDGHIYHGSFGFAGELGHVSIDYNGPQCECGNKGCLELYCSTLALLRKVQEISGNQNISDFNNIKELFNQGNPQIIELVKEIGFYLGVAIVNLVNSYNPGLVVLNGEMTIFGSILLNSIKETVKERLSLSVYSRLKIEFSSLSGSPVLLGTIAMICEYVFEKPDLKLFIDA